MRTNDTQTRDVRGDGQQQMERMSRTNLPACLLALRENITRMRAACVRQRKLLIGLLALLPLVCLFGAWRVQRDARARLADERARLTRQHLVPFETKLHPALNRPEVQIWQSAQHVRAIARLHDAYFAATDGGLLALTQTGAPVRHYTVLDGLPESDLTSLAAWHDKLFIGTRTQGLVTFDGARFESYRWPDRKPQAITALLADASRLLIGTFAGGLIEFDGQQFTELKAGVDERRLTQINCLVRAGARLYVGTYADGLWVLEAGRWLHYTTDAGLPSNRVVGVVADDARVLVGTDFGVATAQVAELSAPEQARANPFHLIITLPALAGLQEFNGRVLLCQDDGKLFVLAAREAHGPQLQAITWRDARTAHDSLTECRLLALADELWLLTSAGVWRTNTTAVTDSVSTRASFALTPFMPLDAGRGPVSNVVAALALDGAGRLWVGSFRDGIDILAPDGRRLTHLATDTTREINALAYAPDTNTMHAATAQGLARFDAALHETHTGAADGLLSNAITGVAVLPAQDAQGSVGQASAAGAAHHAQDAELVCATSRGLRFGAGGRWRGLTTVQGLPSNSLYAVLPHGRTVYVGTLGGLAEVAAGRVVRTFTDANSKLTHNWVTALCAAGPRLFIGTYGGGVFELLPAGELRPFASETGQFTVNPNALWSDGARLYAGTLDGAWVLDLRTQKWTHLQAELPAPTVLSVTGDERYSYFGTTNGIARIAGSYFE